MSDTAPIHALVRRGRRRLRLQAALDGAALAAVAASAVALGLIFAVRLGALPADGAGLWIAGAVAAIVGAGALVGALRRVSTEAVATRIDRASGLADRLASACAFEGALADERAVPPDEETRALMRAAIADAVVHVPRADVRAATPFAPPRDGKAALAFAGVAAIIGALELDTPPRDPRIAYLAPTAAPRKVRIDVVGERLCGADRAAAASDEADDACARRVEILFGAGEATSVATVGAVTSRNAELVLAVEVPADATPGKTFVRVRVDGRTSWPRPFEILRDGDPRYRPAELLTMDEEDVDFARDLLADLSETAAEMQDPALETFAREVEALLEKADRGEISQEELLDELAKAEKAYMEGARPEEVDRAMAELEKTGKELQKKELTKPIGDALEKGDLAKAQEEMKKLAEKLDKGELSDKQRADAAKALDKAAEAFDGREAAEQKALDKKLDKARAEQQKAEAERDAAKDEADKQRLAKKAEERRRRTEALEQQKQQREESEQRRTLKRLHRNMKKAAEQMAEDQAPEQNRREASRTMEDMARDTGKVDADKRKMATQTKTRSQLDDLREAMRRAKKGGSQGAKDRFGRNNRNRDFERRARGGRGSKSAWQRGQGGQKPGGGQQPGGGGQQPGGSSYGDGTDPDVMGDPTARQGNTKDTDLQGEHGKGPSTKETILSAAQKGFSSQSYRQVYGRYKAIVEEVIRAEKVPSGYKFYVKKYFQKIKPHAM